jgi:hypothetical protein
METERALQHGLLAMTVAALAFTAQLSAQQITGAAIPGRCADPPQAAQRQRVLSQCDSTD